ncbi:MAG: YfcL family protein [Alishewanella aestuarii]
MQENNTEHGNTEYFIARAAEFFDQLVPVATDDELFAAGYLRGHVDLAVGTLQLTEQPFSVATLLQQVNSSLQQAIAQGELNATDELLVQDIWQRLQQAA